MSADRLFSSPSPRVFTLPPAAPFLTELARGLTEPMGVAITADGACLVSESAAGRVVRIRGGRGETVIDGLQQPQGIVVVDGKLIENLHVLNAERLVTMAQAIEEMENV